MKRWMKHSLLFCGLILFLLLASMLVVPWQIKKQGIAWIDSETARTLKIEKVSFNPFTLTVEINGLNLSEPNSDATFFSFARLMLSASSRSIVDLALVFDRVELDAPRLNLEQFAKQDFNFSDFTRLGENQPSPPVEEPGKPFQFSLNNLVLRGGSIDFTDRTSVRKSPHTIRELNLQVPFIGNLPYLTDEYVEPLLSMILNGSEIRVEGQLKPFNQSIETNLTLFLDAIDLAFYAYHFPLPLPIEVKSGEVDAEINLSYRVSSTEQPKLLLGGELALTDLDLRELDGRELFRMPVLILDLDWADLMKREVNLLSLDLYEPELFVSREQNGLFNFQHLLPEQAETAPDKQTLSDEKSTSLPLFKAEQVVLHKGQIHYQDNYPPGGFSEEIQGINLQLDNLSTHLDEMTQVEFNLQTARKLNLAISGQLSLQPVTAELFVSMEGFLLKPHNPFLAELLTKPLEGTLSLSSNLQFDVENNLRLQQAKLDLHNLVVPFDDKDRFVLQDFSISGGSFDLHQQQLEIEEIRLANGDLSATRRADGSLSPLDLLRHKPEDQAKTVPTVATEETESEELKITVASFDIDNLNLQFTDASLSKQPRIKVEQLALSLTNLSYPESAQSPFELRGNIGKKGSFAINGTLAHTPLRLQAQSSITAFPLADFNDFIPDQIKINLKDGKLYSTLSLWMKQQPQAFTGGFSGNLALNRLSVRDPLDQSEMLAWESLRLEKIEGNISPLQLHIKDVILSNYSARIQITPDGRINLQNVTAEESDAEQRQEPEKPVAKNQPVAENSPQPDIRIDTVTLQGGTVSFADRHLPTHFSTSMYKLGGRISGLSSNREMLADVDLRGQLEKHSLLKISGKINPLQKDLYADIKMSFKDIDLSPMSSYSGTYLGYVIEKGKLNLNLKYLIENQQINAGNQIFIDQFTFGQKVESDQATSLPVSLAVALLKDSNGEIHLDVPVSGDLNDPEFSVGGVIFTVLKNLLIKAATSPFSLLASLMGGGEDFTSIPFDSGLSTLAPSSLQKLENLAQMLTGRPGLKLEISGFADRENDAEGYRKEILRQQLLAAKQGALDKQGLELSAEETLEIAPEEYSTYLTQVYEEATFPRPRNFIGLLKALPDSEMEKLLLSNIVVGEHELLALAEQRAMATRDALTTYDEGLSPRIFLKKTDIYQPAEDNGPPSRVEFGIGAN